jgi:Reverse transcriptase (RNA-dependent DNA polymerase)
MSPFIFNITIDFLARWIGQLGQLQMLKQPFDRCRLCLLYADDVLIFLQANSQQIMLLKCIFNQFQRISGLKLNLEKSELLVTTDRQGKTHRLAALMHCQASQFPITHLGLPLSDKRLPRESFYRLIHQEEKRLSGWKADTLSIGGRLVLLNSVLSSQPIYYMSVFFLPKWVISRLDKIR